MRRRDLLGSLGAAAITAPLTGCLSGPGAGTPAETPEPTDSGEHPVTPSRTSFDILDRGCGNAENAASVEFGDDSVRIDGIIGGRDTCDIARLVEASLHLDVLTVIVETVREPSTATVACGQCLTDIQYAFSASGLGGGPAEVRVVHRTADGQTTVTVADRP